MSQHRPTDSTETMEYFGLRPPASRPGIDRPIVRVELAAASHPGKVRANNEDHYLVTRMGRTFQAVSTNMPAGEVPDQVDEVAYGLVVADGMGGMAAGERASQLAIRTGVDLVLNSPLWTTRADEEASRQLIDQLRDYFRRVDRAVIGESMSDSHLRGMGTTLTVAYLIDASAIIVHVGDTRAYLFRKGGLRQLTKDHTMAQGLADAGAIRPDEVQNHAKRHVLINFVGGPTSGVEPEVHNVKLEDGDVLLLCSDGLSEMVKDAQIAGALGQAVGLDASARALIELALDGGGRDNVTVVLAKISIATNL